MFILISQIDISTNILFDELMNDAIILVEAVIGFMF